VCSIAHKTETINDALKDHENTHLKTIITN